MFRSGFAVRQKCRFERLQYDLPREWKQFPRKSRDKEILIFIKEKVLFSGIVRARRAVTSGLRFDGRSSGIKLF